MKLIQIGLLITVGVLTIELPKPGSGAPSFSRPGSDATAPPDFTVSSRDSSTTVTDSGTETTTSSTSISVNNGKLVRSDPSARGPPSPPTPSPPAPTESVVPDATPPPSPADTSAPPTPTEPSEPAGDLTTSSVSATQASVAASNLTPTEMKNIHRTWDWAHFIYMDAQANAHHKGIKDDLISYYYTSKNISSYDWKAKGYTPAEWKTE